MAGLRYFTSAVTPRINIVFADVSVATGCHSRSTVRAALGKGNSKHIIIIS
jgi:hypothetical protein